MEHELSTTPDTTSGQDSLGTAKEFEALQAVIAALQPLAPEARLRIYDSAGTFLRISAPRRSASAREAGHPSSLSTPSIHPRFSEDTAMSPKEFLREKQPRTDVERVACLGYYLTHYRDIPHFKTLDLSKLNTEAAQPKFANAAYATNNAIKRGYLAPATKGQRQLSASGEQFVQALPDRDAAKATMASARPKRTNRRAKATFRKSGGSSS